MDSKRKPVLVFEDVRVLRHWIKADDRERSESVETCYAIIESGNIPNNFPIIATESANYPSIEKHFYFIPILEYAFINIGEADGRILKIAASAKGCRPVSGAEHHSRSDSATIERICGRIGEGESGDLIGWVSEKDLVDPDIQSIDVRVLLDRRQFDALTTTMREVMTACRISLISGEPLIATLRSIPSVASRGGLRIQHAASLDEAAILPKFLYELPHQSRLATLGDELWSRWSIEEKMQFLEEIDAKLQLYKAIIEHPNGWVALNRKDEQSKYVYPLSLNVLP